MSQLSNRPTGMRLTELTPQDQKKLSDMDWCLGDVKVLNEYAGQMVAVSEHRVWGSGNNYTAAWNDASKKEGCPTIDQIVFVVLPERVHFDPREKQPIDRLNPM